MVIGHGLGKHSELGWLVSNHLIRRAAFEAVQESLQKNGDITLIAGETVASVRTERGAAHVTVGQRRQTAGAAAGRRRQSFSTTRRAMGIAADLHDFGRSMLVCCMTHEVSHEHAAWEWFGYGQTLALLPMNDDLATAKHRSSVVLTLPSHEIDPLVTLAPDEFNVQMAHRFEQRLGTMTLASTRHAYPLVAVYPRRLIGQRFACVGDAAVGMHPVTATASTSAC
ncbi:MAG: hypothetical protein MZW92_09040 [Comamonadaceae bacterium]|nr:hypothetical protein [Comamonadaceae bacterium]